jgi:squalene-hopene/tetraprenyl-beta-curcumene cyclase
MLQQTLSSSVIERAVRASSDEQPSLSQAINLAASALLSDVRPEGHWHGELIVDATLCADVIFYLWWSGRSDAGLESKCLDHIERRMLPDGGWAIYEGGPAELNATLKCVIAMRMAGVPGDDERLAVSEAIVRAQGGVQAANTYTRFWLALLGLLDWKALPAIPPEIVLLPRSCPIHLGRLSAWSRVILVPMSIIRHHRPAPATQPAFDLSSLMGTRSARRWHWSFGQLPFLAIDWVIRFAESTGVLPFRKRALDAAEKWMLERCGEGSDGLGAVFPSMLNALIALQTLGFPEDHPVMQKAVADFEGLYVEDANGFRIQPCLSPVWDTAIAIVALNDIPGDATQRAVENGCRWLREREVRFAGDWAADNPGAVPSGWAFEYNNKFYPDLDDSAMVLVALARNVGSLSAGATTGADAYVSPLRRAFDWIVALQCADGGWAAFDRDAMDRWLECVPFADHNAILDPSCSDVTARVLEAIGTAQLQFEYADPVRRAVAYLRSTQTSDGCWYGRWGVNYIYGTWQTLRGLRAIGHDMNEPWIQHGADWLKAHQNSDGGWGESPRSYEGREAWGIGESTPSQTAWALMGLMASGEFNSPAVRRGVSHLVETQRTDGWWDEPATTGTGFPQVFYLKYDYYRLVWPLIALQEYERGCDRE